MGLPSCRYLLGWPWAFHLGHAVPLCRPSDAPPGPIPNTAFLGSLPPSPSQVRPSSCHFALGIYHLCFVSWFTRFIPLINLSPSASLLWIVASCLWWPLWLLHMDLPTPCPFEMNPSLKTAVQHHTVEAVPWLSQSVFYTAVSFSDMPGISTLSFTSFLATLCC